MYSMYTNLQCIVHHDNMNLNCVTCSFEERAHKKQLSAFIKTK